MKRIECRTSLALWSILIMASLFILPSCHVEKRKYTKGFYISKNLNKKVKGRSDVENEFISKENLDPEKLRIEPETMSTSNTFEKHESYDSNQLAASITEYETSGVDLRQGIDNLELSNSPKDSKRKLEIGKTYTKKGFKQAPRGGFNSSPWVFLLAAVLFALLAFLFFYYLGIVGLIFAIIFWIISIVYALLGLVLLIFH